MQELWVLIQTTQIELPAMEVVVLVGLLSLSLLLRYARCGMVIAYLFSYRWGWQVADSLQGVALFGYIAFGMLIGVLSVIGMLYDHKHS